MRKVIFYVISLLINVWMINMLYPDDEFLILMTLIIVSTITILQALDSYRRY